MLPLQFVDAIAEALEALMLPAATDTTPGYTVQTEPLDPQSNDQSISVFPRDWIPDEETIEIGGTEPTINHYNLLIQNLTIHGDVQAAYTRFTNDQRKIRAILYRDATLRVSLAGMSEVYLGSVERFTRLKVIRQTSLPARRLGMLYFLCETNVQIDTETTAL